MRPTAISPPVDGPSPAGKKVIIMHAAVLMGLYVAIVAAAQVVGYFVGLFIERSVPAIGLSAYLAVSLGMLVLAWPIAVRLTEYLLGPEPRA